MIKASYNSSHEYDDDDGYGYRGHEEINENFVYDMGLSSSGANFSSSNCNGNISPKILPYNSTLFLVTKIIFCCLLMYIGASYPCIALLLSAVINYMMTPHSWKLISSAASSATNIFRSKYHTILDNGSTFTFSGDINIFVKSTLV